MARPLHRKAVAEARRVLREFGVRSPDHIDIEAMARDQGAEIVEQAQALPEVGAAVSLLWVPERVAGRLGMFE